MKIKHFKRTIQIKINKIEVAGREYEIWYQYKIDDGEWQEEYYGSDFDNGDTPNEWKETLIDGVALDIVTQQVVENL
jgi:hypothetical protein